jgi:hypothetical protein
MTRVIVTTLGFLMFDAAFYLAFQVAPNPRGHVLKDHALRVS